MSSRLPATVASAVGRRGTIAIRRAEPADGAALARLEALAEQRLPNGPLLLAEVDGELVAATAASGMVIADPFRVTLDVVELLRLRYSQLRVAA